MKTRHEEFHTIPGEKIHPECLSIEKDRVFVSYDPISKEIRTATRWFWSAFKTNVWVAKLVHPISPVPKKGRRLRFTMWHNAVPVKIELKIKGSWETIYELNELPYGLKCLAGCYTKGGTSNES
jgi:hypothetical protein